MVFLFNLFSFTVVTVLVLGDSSVPFKILHAHPTQLASALILAEIPPTIEHNIERNAIQSAEENVNCIIHGTYADDQLTGNTDKLQIQNPKTYFAPIEHFLTQRAETKQFLRKTDSHSKFYRNGQRSNSMSDAIVFPSDGSESETQKAERNSLVGKGFESEMRNRYSNIRMPHDNPEIDIPLEKAVQHQPDVLPLLSSTQEQLTYELLSQLVRNIFRRSGDSKPSEGSPTLDETTTENPNEGVDFQSLYSGPRFTKIPCPAGQHRTHNGLCQEASRKLQNSRG